MTIDLPCPSQYTNDMKGITNMGFLKNLFGGGASAKPDKCYYVFNVK